MPSLCSGTRSSGDLARFFAIRSAALAPVNHAARSWNEAVAALVDQVGQAQINLAAKREGEEWHERVANALRRMGDPLRSDVILSAKEPRLKNSFFSGAVRAFSTTTLDQDLEFMPKPMAYPKFPYFQVEPATHESLSKSGLCLLTNPPGIDADEPDKTGTRINPHTYLRVPTISVELDLSAIGPEEYGAILLNWSFRGRAGAHAKIFINGEQDVPAFEVMSADDDGTPNFWTFIPWTQGKVIVDLKHVGQGYLWFEHVDVHHVRWTE
jgi:hypothetical protein